MLPDEYVTKDNHEREEYLASLSPEELLQLGIDLYNAGHYWHAHEAWEEVWLEAPREMRLFYQGLIQVAAAFVHVTRSEYPGGVKLLQAGIEKLDRYPGDYLGVDVVSLLNGARKAYVTLLELGEKHVADFNRGSIPRISRAALRHETS
jgi:predicted metal-dependent hydrolase